VVAGFGASVSVDTPPVVAGFGGHTSGRPPRTRTATLAALRQALAVSRRTPVASSIRRSDQPSRPSARTCCLFSSPKTLAIPAVDHAPPAFVNVSVRLLLVAGFQVSLNGRFLGVSQREHLDFSDNPFWSTTTSLRFLPERDER